MDNLSSGSDCIKKTHHFRAGIHIPQIPSFRATNLRYEREVHGKSKYQTACHQQQRQTASPATEHDSCCNISRLQLDDLLQGLITISQYLVYTISVNNALRRQKYDFNSPCPTAWSYTRGHPDICILTMILHLTKKTSFSCCFFAYSKHLRRESRRYGSLDFLSPPNIMPFHPPIPLSWPARHYHGTS